MINFKLFSSRKSFLESSKTSQNNLNFVSYIEPINYDKINKKKLKSIDFHKMTERKVDGRIKSPPVCMYNPQNDSIIKRIEKFLYNKSKMKPNKSKIFSSFHQTLNYQMVKFKENKSISHL